MAFLNQCSFQNLRMLRFEGRGIEGFDLQYEEISKACYGFMVERKELIDIILTFADVREREAEMKALGKRIRRHCFWFDSVTVLPAQVSRVKIYEQLAYKSSLIKY